MLDASSSAMACPTLQAVKPVSADPATPDAASVAVVNNSHVQVWMQAMRASAKTAEAILELPIGGPAPVE